MNELDTHVLIIGAGPTGLVLALWLARLGVRVKIIDKTAGPGTTSRAVAVQTRTLEFYDQLGLADEVIAHGRKAMAANIWVAGRKVARGAFGDMGAGQSPYPFALIYPQDEHERLLIAKLAELGVTVDRETELATFDESGDRIVARLRKADGVEERCVAAYIAGCDGAHSAVRETLGIGFPGGTYDHLFYVADVIASGPTMNGELHVGLDVADFLAVFPLREDGRARLIGTVRDDATHGDQLSWEDVSQRVVEWLGIHVDLVNWFSTYRVHHRVADRFRRGRGFLLGDAAHIHSPVGGQGMNTGIGDAVNLAWKLAAVVQGRAIAAILDSYEPERIAFARHLVATTDRAFTAVTSARPLARLLRLKLVPLLMPTVFKFRSLRPALFRLVSQTGVAYRDSSLSAGRAGAIRGGDRLPWVPAEFTGTGGGNFAPLTSLDWQVHIYGTAPAGLRAVCQQRGLPLHAFPWNPAISHSGLRRDTAYLVRPDGYIALVDAGGGAEVDRYSATLALVARA